MALHDRPHGRRLRHGRHPAVLRPVRRHQGRASPARTSSATPTCSAASARGRCTRCRSRSPSGCSRPRPSDVAHAQRVIEAMGDGTGAIMLDGKMEDDASVQAVPGRGRSSPASSPPATPSSPRRTGSEHELTSDLRPAPPPLGALHAGRQRAGAREGEDDRRPTRSSSTSRTPSRPTRRRRPAPTPSPPRRRASTATASSRSAATGSTPRGAPTTSPPPPASGAAAVVIPKVDSVAYLDEVVGQPRRRRRTGRR